MGRHFLINLRVDFMILEEKINIIGIILFIFLCLIVLFIVIYISIYNSKYRNFVINNSDALHSLKDINKRFKFKDINNFNLENSYDNEFYYNEISCKDYLTYQLVYIKNIVDNSIVYTINNRKLYNEYKACIEKECIFNNFGNIELLKDVNKLSEIERKLFNKAILKPQLDFNIFVNLVLTNINGVYKESKNQTFSISEIRNIEYKLSQKNGSFYLNEDVWKSLCRVERGKVSNKMRFAIYERDGYRCRICGRKTNDLEIDHIIPIAKGGKSTYDNLQTLCHRCNYNKGDKL